MNKERFQELITKPDNILDSDLVQLQQVVREFPYFHNAHLLLLYGLYKHNSDKFNEQLKHSSLCLSDRSFFVSALYQGWQNRSGQIVKDESPLPESVAAPIVTIKEGVPEEADISPVADFEPEPVREVILEVTPTAIPEPAIEEDKEPEPFRENSNEDSFTFSFDESHTIETPEKKEIEDTSKHETSVDLLELDMSQPKADDEGSEDLIDYFLKVNPRIVPKLDLEDSRGDISKPGLEENDEIVTETLASIYEQQGHFLKAKEAFQKLILKFPEKSTYFASRIQELEKRIK